MLINYEIETNIYYIKTYDISTKNLNDFITYLNNIFEKTEHFSIIFDLSELLIKDFLFSKKILDFMDIYKNKTNKYLNKTAVILNNKIIITLLNNIYKPVKPNIITDNLEKSILFIKDN
tara:strand:+ start:6423 stop:6779 length:357 start_codon:yes stop_codon:yes gene_type:complete